MTAISAKELKSLIADLEKDPTNLDLINKVAIGYFENYEQKSDKEDYDFFKRAYTLKKTVKSTHNFAWFLYFERAEFEGDWNESSAVNQALKVQNECIQLNPKSYYPYSLYGYMLLDQKRYREAIPYFEKANKIEKRREFTHDLAYCYFQLQDYHLAYELFDISAQADDLESVSLFNLALACFKTDRLDQLKSIAERLKAEISCHKIVSGYEIAFLFYLLEDYSLATACLLEQGIDRIDLFEWPELSYSLFLSDSDLWRKEITRNLNRRIDWIAEIEGDHERWADFSTAEKSEGLNEFKSEVAALTDTLERGMKKPQSDLLGFLLVEYCGCLLFDCSRHGNLENDE
ncbi:tetratricopeptide repeat protein [Croceimicrobium hydrocarbonivorans]|uniref:Uncharacterized protein n=1 Tax=Croceimicrobium hydrocarbonivorans TaxID=2761580 RepID=A0A7H0VDQ0_9FLAO|nr:CDC27 family protein [Croceimicrobium hydrocarbonivorans]QNR23848.1 hypothetical protein H4K34_15950 [Croceimicrobium hydrocarbonivorans]